MYRFIAFILLVSAVYPVSLDRWGFLLSAALMVFFAGLYGVYAFLKSQNAPQQWWKRLNSGLSYWTAKLNIVFILLLALLLRLVVLCCCDLTQISDYHDFNQIALSILQGGAWFDPGRPPGISWLTALCYAVAGVHVWVPLLANICVSLWAIFIVWAGGKLLFNSKIAVWSAFLMAIYPEHIIHANYLCSEPGYFWGINAGILWYAISIKKTARSYWFLIFSGIALGVGHYFRSTTPLVFFSMALAEGLSCFQADWEHRKALLLSALKRLTIVTGVFLLTISPVLWHNRQDLGIWSIASYQMGGWSMYLATNPVYLGNWNMEDVVFFDSLYAAHPAPATANAYLYRDSLAKHLAWERFKAHPGAFFSAVCFFKPYCLWGDPSGSFWVNQQFAPGTFGSRFFGLWLVVWHKCILCAAGLALWHKKWRNAYLHFPLLSNIFLWFSIFNTVLFVMMGTEGRYHNVLLGWLCWWASVAIIAQAETKT